MSNEDYSGNIIRTREESIESTTAWYNRLSSIFSHGMGCGKIRCGECPLYVRKDDKCGVDKLRCVFESMKGVQ